MGGAVDRRRQFTGDEVQALIEVVAIYRSAQAIIRDMRQGVLWDTARGKETFRERVRRG